MRRCFSFVFSFVSCVISDQPLDVQLKLESGVDISHSSISFTTFLFFLQLWDCVPEKDIRKNNKLGKKLSKKCIHQARFFPPHHKEDGISGCQCYCDASMYSELFTRKGDGHMLVFLARERSFSLFCPSFILLWLLFESFVYVKDWTCHSWICQRLHQFIQRKAGKGESDQAGEEF